MSNYAIFPVENSEDFKPVNDILGRDDIIVNSINYKTDIVKFPLIIEVEYIKRQDSIHYKKLNNIKSDKAKIITYDEAVFKVENNNGPALDSVNDVKESSVSYLDTSHSLSMTSEQAQYDKVVKTHSQDDNVNDTVIIPASELKPYSTTMKENKKPKENKLYFYCSYMLDNVISNKYYSAKNKKSARDNIHNIALRYKKSKGYNKVDFEIIELKEISRAEYENSLK